MSTGGLKYDAGKIRWDLLPLGALEEVAKVYTYGCQKYTVGDVTGAWNWRKGIGYAKCFASLMRHLHAWWWKRETLDQESGCHHLASVAFYVLNFLCYEQDGRKDLDDRPSAAPQPKPSTYSTAMATYLASIDKTMDMCIGGNSCPRDSCG
jgi:hypothetical protein